MHFWNDPVSRFNNHGFGVWLRYRFASKVVKDFKKLRLNVDDTNFLSSEKSHFFDPFHAGFYSSSVARISTATCTFHSWKYTNRQH
jgi:hypothetical protein